MLHLMFRNSSDLLERLLSSSQAGEVIEQLEADLARAGKHIQERLGEAFDHLVILSM
jgi:hypothetical protein